MKQDKNYVGRTPHRVEGSSTRHDFSLSALPRQIPQGVEFVRARGNERQHKHH